MINLWKIVLFGGLVLALAGIGRGLALAQTGQSPVPMEWQMSWPMLAGCTLIVIVLLLAAAALIKYLVFR